MKLLLTIWRCVYYGVAILTILAFYQDSLTEIGVIGHSTTHWHRIQPLCLTVMAIELVVQWRRRKSGVRKEPSPVRSAMGVVIVTGITALALTAPEAFRSGAYYMPLAILAATVAICLPVYRFASTHAGEIGEARFDTTSPRH